MDQESQFLSCYYSADPADRMMLEKVLVGFLSGRLTITLNEARFLTIGEWRQLAGSLPDDPILSWLKCERSS
jgi:hypothetical protein